MSTILPSSTYATLRYDSRYEEVEVWDNISQSGYALNDPRPKDEKLRSSDTTVQSLGELFSDVESCASGQSVDDHSSIDPLLELKAELRRPRTLLDTGVHKRYARVMFAPEDFDRSIPSERYVEYIEAPSETDAEFLVRTEVEFADKIKMMECFQAQIDHLRVSKALGIRLPVIHLGLFSSALRVICVIYPLARFPCDSAARMRRD